MNNRQIAKYGMFHLVLSFCNRYLTIIKTIPAFGYAFNTFQDLVKTIDQAAPQAARKTTGPAAAKKQSRQNLQAQTLAISSLLYAFASEKNDAALKEKVRYTKREFNGLAEEELIPVCKVIWGIARDLLTQMADYNLTEVQLNELDSAISEYHGILSLPRLEENDVRTAANRIQTLFKEAETVLNEKMDNIAESMKENEPDFYTGYFKSRRINDPATRHTKLTGIINDKTTGKVVAGVVVMHEVTGLKAVTNDLGEFQFDIPLTGDQQILVQKEGYKSTVETVKLKLGQSSQVEWMLDPAA